MTAARYTDGHVLHSEAEASEGERKQPPPDLAAQMAEMDKLSIGEPEFFDLKQPWIYSPVTFLIVPSRGLLVARSGMTYRPCRTHDPGGVVAGPGGVGGPLIGTRPPRLG